MILIEFMCHECEITFEEFTEYCTEHDCPKCGKKANKIMSAPGVNMQWWKNRLKGEMEFAQNPHAKNANMKAEASYQDWKRNPRL